MNSFSRKLEITGDGSTTFYIPEIDEHYHSTNGAIVEAKHVYLKEALEQRLKAPYTDPIRILEVGFGTGLNAFLTMLWSQEHQISIHYVTLELYPLSLDDIKTVNYPNQIDPTKNDLFIQMHQASWNETVQITPYFVIEKLNIDLTKDVIPSSFDVIYFDAFAPDKQPEMWSESIFKKVFESCRKEAVLTTYCAKGVVRRGFQQVGFQMERIPGPPGKREMIRGTKKFI